jgi:predicted PurR-regulated permease PerM
VRFWSWLVLAVTGVALNSFGGSPFPELGIGILFAASLFAPPLSEFQRTVHPRGYSSIVVFVLLLPVSLLALAVLGSSSFSMSRVVPGPPISAFKAWLLALWVWVALRELQRFRRLRRPDA